MLEQGWPFLAELDIPEGGLIKIHGLSDRLGEWLKFRDTQRGSGLDAYRRRFRTEEEADAFVAEFGDVGARRG